MGDRFILSTEIKDEKIQYHLFDKETEKMYVCGTGELNSLMWKLLGVWKLWLRNVMQQF